MCVCVFFIFIHARVVPARDRKKLYVCVCVSKMGYLFIYIPEFYIYSIKDRMVVWCRETSPKGTAEERERIKLLIYLSVR